jgi:hypothetical protein
LAKQLAIFALTHNTLWCIVAMNAEKGLAGLRDILLLFAAADFFADCFQLVR